MTGYLPREISRILVGALRHLPVVVVSGLRQCGKSTLLLRDRAFSKRAYHTLDDFAVMAAATNDPEDLLRDRIPITFDEVQRYPELLLAIKRNVDRDRRNGRFLLTGSANLALMARVSETLAGRAAYFTLQPMTRREVRGHTRAKPGLLRVMDGQSMPAVLAEPVQDDEVLRGGLPPVCLDSGRGTQAWLRGYVQTYVERDVRQLSQVTDLVSFRMLANLAAMRTSQVLNVSVLARDVKLASTTAARYLDLLETSFLVRRLPPFLKNRSLRLVKSPKLYFSDSGLAAYLSQTTSLSPLSAGSMRGALMETYALQNISAILEAHRPEAMISYWHEQGRHEVDFVIEEKNKVWAMEIKAASRWSESDLSGLRAFLARTPQCVAGILAYNGETAVSLGSRIWAVPLGYLLT